MAELLLKEDWGEYGTLNIIEIKNGQSEVIKSIRPIDYQKAFEYINNNYEYAKVICGSCIK